MKMKRFLAGIMTAVLLTGSLAGCGDKKEGGQQGGDTQPIQIRYMHDLTTESVEHESVLYLQKLIAEKSNGAMELVIFPGGQMGTNVDALDKVGRGDIEMSQATSSNYTQSIPEVAVWDSFYLFDDAEHAYRVFDSEVGQEVLNAYEKKGVTALGYLAAGFRNISNSKHPVNTVEDVNGLKLRGYNPIQIKAWESLGASMASISWSELFTALQQNLIDGQECAMAGFYQQKFYEAQKYLSLSGHIYTNYVLYVNTDFLNSLSEENQKIFRECVDEFIQYERNAMDEAESETLQKLADAGCEINEISQEERQKMGEIMNAAIKDDIIAQCGQELYDKVMAEVDNQRQK